MFKDKYIARYCINVGGTRQFIKSKKINPNNPAVDFDGETFMLDVKHSEYRRKNKVFFLFEKNVGQIIPTGKELQINQKLVKSLFIQELPKQLVAGLKERDGLTSSNIMFALLGIFAGVGLGWIICSLVA